MPGIDDILNIATQAILTHRATLEVVSHNIANANTPGFSRQKSFLENNSPVDDFFGKIGTGVFLRAVQREADIFLNNEIWTNTSGLGRYDVQNLQLQRIEGIFNESADTGLNKAISEFFASWNDLADKPEGIAERAQVLERGKILRDIFHRGYDQLEEVSRLLSPRLTQVVSLINALAEEIRSLNIRVANTEGQGSDANDDRDLREEKMKELAKYVSFQSIEDGSTGMVTITVGGLPLVAGNIAQSLSAETPTLTSSSVNVVRRDGSKQDVTNLISGGQIKGILDLRNTIIPDKKTRLTTLAREIIEEVNRAHSRGVGLATDSTGKSAGFTSVSTRVSIEHSTTFSTALTTAGSPFALTDGGTFTINAYDSSGNLIAQRTFTIDANNDAASLGGGATHTLPAGTLTELASNINNLMGTFVTATVSTVGPGTTAQLTLGTSAGTSYFTLSDDTSDFLSILGMNTFFTGDDSRDMDINPVVLNDVNKINAAMVDRRPFLSGSFGAGTTGFSLSFGSSFTPGKFTIDVYDASGNVIETKTITVKAGNTVQSLSVGSVGVGIDATFENLDASFNAGAWFIQPIGLGASFAIKNSTTSVFQNLRMSDRTPGPRNFSQGDNRTALSISSLETALLLNGNTQSFSEYYSDFTGRVGAEVQTTMRNFDQQELVVEQLEDFRDARAGVNLDEEMAKMIKYEQAYNAAARLVVLVQELTDRLLQAIGA